MILIIGGRGAIGIALRAELDRQKMQYRVLVSANKNPDDRLQLSLDDLKESKFYFFTWIYIYTNYPDQSLDFKKNYLEFSSNLITSVKRKPRKIIYFDSFYNQPDPKCCPNLFYSEAKKDELALLKKFCPAATVVVLRLHQVVANYNGLHRPGLIPFLVNSISKKEVPLLNSPDQKLRFLHINDLIDKLISICKDGHSRSEIVETFSTNKITLQQFVDDLCLYIEHADQEKLKKSNSEITKTAKTINFEMVGRYVELNNATHRTNLLKIFGDLVGWARELEKND